jgi:putative DNA primase/helicase
MVYRDRPWWIKVHGHEGMRLLDLVNGGRKPRGEEFPEAVRQLCRLAGVPFPEKEQTKEQQEHARRLDARRGVLEDVAALCEEYLWNTQGGGALDYLREKRRLTDEQIRNLHAGLYPSKGDLCEQLRQRGHDDQAIEDASAGWKKIAGYIVLPWCDDRGRMLTLYGRWPGEPPNGKPKTIALPGDGSKGSPYCLDRARCAGHRELIVVEGLFDAAVLQVRGETRAVASVAAQFSGEQIQTLKRCRIDKVHVVGDPDGGGDRGTADNVKSLMKVGITAYVPPRLPDGMDPDEFVLEHGLEAWQKNISKGIHGFRHIARLIISERGQREPGDDQWGDDIVKDAREFAKQWGQEHEDALRRHFWPQIAQATGSAVEDLCRTATETKTRHNATDSGTATKQTPFHMRTVSPYQPFPIDALPVGIRGYVRQAAAALGCGRYAAGSASTRSAVSSCRSVSNNGSIRPLTPDEITSRTGGTSDPSTTQPLAKALKNDHDNTKGTVK